MIPKDKFIPTFAPLVQKYGPRYGVLCNSAVIGQAILESGWGTTQKAQFNNFFGLKYRPDRCPSAYGTFWSKSDEQNPDGSYRPVFDQWFAFTDPEMGVRGYYEYVSDSRYDNSKGIKDPEEYLTLIRKDGYATSLKYVEKVMKVVEDNKLRQYDQDPGPQPSLYKVQCGAFTVEANAKALEVALQSVGFQTCIVKGTKYFKVQCGAYKVFINAVRQQRRLLNNGFEAIIVD